MAGQGFGYGYRGAYSMYVPYSDVTPVSPRPATVPAVAPVTLEQVKAQARVDNDDEDDLIAIHLAAALDGIERETGHYMGQVALDAYLPWFDWYSMVFLPGGWVQSVTEIVYRDEDGVEQTWAAANWELQRFRTESSVRRAADGEALPRSYFYSDYGREDRQAVRIRYVAGYANADDVPVGLRQAVLMMAAEFYIQREAHVTQPGVIAIDNPAVMTLLRAHKVRWPT